MGFLSGADDDGTERSLSERLAMSGWRDAIMAVPGAEAPVFIENADYGRIMFMGRLTSMSAGIFLVTESHLGYAYVDGRKVECAVKPRSAVQDLRGSGEQFIIVFRQQPPDVWMISRDDHAPLLAALR